MKNFLKKYKNYKINSLIILSFLILSIFNIALLFHFGRIFLINDDDMQFHWNRVASLMRDSVFTKYALSSFSSNGSAVMTMYPYLFLYPLIFVFRIIHSVSLSSVVMYFVNTLASLNICYFSSLHFSKSKLLSYLFSVLYTISSYIFFSNVQIYDIGMTYSYIFMPLVLFGFIYWLNENKWLMMSIGMTLIIYSNVIITAITPIILLMYILISYKKLNVNKIVNLVKSAFLALCASSIFWIPALNLYVHNRLRLPYWNNISSIGLHFVEMPWPSFISSPLTIYSLLGFGIGLIGFKHLKCFNHGQLQKLYLVSACILVFCSKIIPWNLLFNHTFIRTIQYTGRLVLIPQVIFVYVLATLMTSLLNNISLRRKVILMCSLVLLVILGQFVFQSCSIAEMNDGKYQGTYATIHNTLQSKINDVSSTDYYPKFSKNFKNDLVNDRGIVTSTNSADKKKIIKFKSHNHGHFTFYLPTNAKEITVPFLHYNNVKYQNYLDGVKAPVTFNKGQVLTLHNVKSGYHSYDVHIVRSKDIVPSEIITIFGMLMYLICCISHIYLKNNKYHRNCVNEFNK